MLVAGALVFPYNYAMATAGNHNASHNNMAKM